MITKLGLLFSISNFFINKTALGRKSFIQKVPTWVTSRGPKRVSEKHKVFFLGACAGVNLARNKFRNSFLIFRIYFIYLVDPVFIFISEIWVELMTNMPYIIRFFRDPFWTFRGPWGSPRGPKILPRTKNISWHH